MSSFFLKFCKSFDQLVTGLRLIQFFLWSYSWLTNRTSALWSSAFVNQSHNYRPYWTPLSPITIINWLHSNFQIYLHCHHFYQTCLKEKTKHSEKTNNDSKYIWLLQSVPATNASKDVWEFRYNCLLNLCRWIGQLFISNPAESVDTWIYHQLINQSISVAEHLRLMVKLLVTEIKTCTICKYIYIGKQGYNWLRSNAVKLKPDSNPVNDEGKGQLKEKILSRFAHYIYNYLNVEQ